MKGNSNSETKERDKLRQDGVMSNESKIKKIMAIVFNNRSLNVLSNDALIEQSSRRARAGIGGERRHKTRQEVVWTSWKMAAAPYQAQWPLRRIVYFARGGGVSRAASSAPCKRAFMARERVWTTLSSDVSKRAILPPRSRCCPNRKLYRALSLFPPLFRSRYVEFLHYDSITFEATVLEL